MMKSLFLAVCLAYAMLAITGCGVRHLAARDAPDRAAPKIDPPADPPPPSSARVYLEVVDGPAPVQKVVEQSTKTERVTTPGVYIWSKYGGSFVGGGTRDVEFVTTKTQPLCITPCWVDLPAGSALLTVGGDQVGLQLPPVKLAYRHALGRHEKAELGSVLGPALVLGLGFGSALTGPLAAIESRPVGIGMTAGGVALIALGFIWLQGVRPVEQPGNGVIFPLE